MHYTEVGAKKNPFKAEDLILFLEQSQASTRLCVAHIKGEI